MSSMQPQSLGLDGKGRRVLLEGCRKEMTVIALRVVRGEKDSGC